MPSFDGRRAWFVTKLLAPVIGVSLVSSLGLIALLYYSGGDLLRDQLRQRVLDEVQFLEYEYREDGLDELVEEIEERLEKNRQSWRYLYALQAPNGIWLFDTVPGPAPALGWSELKGLDYAESTLAKTTLLQGGYRLTVGLSERDLTAYQRTFYTNAGWLFIAGALASAILGALIYRRFAATVQAVAKPVQRFADGDFTARIAPMRAGPDLDQLVSNLNAMFVQVERLIAQLRTLSANIAHDLRTPLTRVKNTLAAAAPGAPPATQSQLEQAGRDLDEVLKLFREILQLSEIRSGRLQAHFQAVDLAAIAREALEVYEPLFDERGFDVRLVAPPRLVLRGSPQLLKQVLVNLLENTLNHTDGACQLQVTLAQDSAAYVVLDVRNSGAWVAAAGAASNQTAAENYGLGLGFISAIAELHGGGAEFGPLPDGGFQCQVRLACRILAQ